MEAEQLQLLARLSAEGRLEEADKASEEAATRFPDDARILRARAIILRRINRDRAEAFLSSLPPAAWVSAQLGMVHQGRDTRKAIEHFRQAFALQSNLDHRLALIHNLGRWGGEGEGEALEEAYQLLKPVLDGARDWSPNNLHIAHHVLQRVCDYDELDRLGTPAELGRKWAASGNHTALLLLLGRATPADEASVERLARETHIEGLPGFDAFTAA